MYFVARVLQECRVFSITCTSSVTSFPLCWFFVKMFSSEQHRASHIVAHGYGDLIVCLLLRGRGHGRGHRGHGGLPCNSVFSVGLPRVCPTRRTMYLLLSLTTPRTSGPTPPAVLEHIVHILHSHIAQSTEVQHLDNLRTISYEALLPATQDDLVARVLSSITGMRAALVSNKPPNAYEFESAMEDAKAILAYMMTWSVTAPDVLVPCWALLKTVNWVTDVSRHRF